jgi:hypothetical protein
MTPPDQQAAMIAAAPVRAKASRYPANVAPGAAYWAASVRHGPHWPPPGAVNFAPECRSRICGRSSRHSTALLLCVSAQTRRREKASMKLIERYPNFSTLLIAIAIDAVAAAILLAIAPPKF